VHFSSPGASLCVCALGHTLILAGGHLLDRNQPRLFDGLVLHVNRASFYKSDGFAMIGQIQVSENSGSPCSRSGPHPTRSWSIDGLADSPGRN
jgi:hypothetical protein